MSSGSKQGGSEQRKHPRVDLLASIELKSGDEMIILTVRNISVGGVFVCNDGYDLLSGFPVGSRHELVIFTPSDLDKQLVVRGLVVRHEAEGMALTWREDDTAATKLTALIEQQQNEKVSR